MISQTAEYALRAVAYLTQHPDEPYPIAVIAEATQVPPSYLAKVMRALSQAGIVRAQRGPAGGFTLAASPQDLTVFDVVDCVTPVPRIRSCPLGLPEHARELCPLHAQLDAATAQIEESLRKATFADLARNPVFPERPRTADDARPPA